MTKETKSLDEKIMKTFVDYMHLRKDILYAEDVKNSIKQVKIRLQKGENINKVFLEEFGGKLSK